MGTFLLALLIVGLLVAAMSVGVIFGRKPITGTCGGLGAAGITGPCEICGGDTSKCENSEEDPASNNLAYDAADAGKRSGS
ncbi:MULTISPECIES: (Na+)-NQR maturation NqrM [Marinobacter]|uniref:(Na+)-NQR maturation NqrM n=1 Tax=Marinobacter TaxID=2742 RepID=UPI00222F0A89|nr:(Na+)-NQR maturation NqrM [Marinobacter sp. AN1]UZD64470.1 (Na+)-NQR maturation NqrM [Marinobacter sp. AN1]